MGDLPLLGTNAKIIRIVEALFGVQPGNVFFTSFQDYAAAMSVEQLADALAPYAGGSAEDLGKIVSGNYQIDPALETDSGDNVLALMETYITAQLNATAQESWGSKILEITNQYANMWTDPLLGESAVKFNDAVVASLVYSVNPNNPEINDPDTGPINPPATDVIALTTAQDNLVGTSADDNFEGIVVDNSNTFQSGDRLDGGEGTDTLNVEIGLSQAFAISAKTTSVEKVFINARSDSFDSNDNNLMNDFVQIDAGDMEGVTEWGTDGSRADVVIEDIRIQDDQITSDITFSMRDTDPGSDAYGQDGSNGTFANDSQPGASLHAYFDANSLRSTTAVSAPTLEIQVLDIQNALYANGGTTAPANPPAPLQDDTNDGFSFTIERPDGSTKDFIISNPDISAANTYDELRDAIEAGFVAAGIDAIVTKSEQLFSAAHKITEELAFGNPIHVELVGEEGVVVAGQWTVGSTNQDANVNIAADIVPLAASESTDLLVSANLILDNVGRGSEGGDAEIGTMSTRGGVGQLNIKVEDSSWVTNVRSTNNALEVVTVVDSDVAKDAVTSGGVVSSGSLYIGSGLDAENNNLVDYRVAPTYVDTNGLVDVRIFNASTFSQELKIGASLTHAGIEKYLQIPSVAANSGVVTTDTDIAGAEGRDTVNALYALGSNNDYLNMSLESDLTADSDFTLTIQGNAGDDNIQTVIDFANHTVVPGVLPTWQAAQASLANLRIDAGTGNDTVRTLGAGNFIINTGIGDDAIYADNTGDANQFVSSDITGLNGFLSKSVWTSNNLNDDHRIATLDLAATDGFSGIRGLVEVTFKGITSNAVSISYDSNAASALNNTTSVWQVRQALKEAVNNDAVLSKLLVVKDGPNNTFVVESLIDGVMSAADLTIDFIYDDVNNGLTDAEIAAGYTAFDTATADFLYDPSLALDDAGVTLTGANSTSISDNTINAGSNEVTANRDVIVLGTTDSGIDTATSSNDTVKFTGLFGLDTIVNFVPAIDSATGRDTLDFTDYLTGSVDGYDVSGSALLRDNFIILGSDATEFVTDIDTSAKGVLLVESSADASVMDVYSLSSTAADTAVDKQFQGTIDLADVRVGDLTVSDFMPVDNEGGDIILPPTGETVVITGDTVGVDGVVENFTYAIDSSTGDVVSGLDGSYTLTDFTVGEDSLTFTDVATGTTSTATFVNDVTTSESAINNLTDIIFDADANGDAFQLTLVGILDAPLETVNMSVVNG